MTDVVSYRKLLSEISIAWNEAEQEIKLAEQVAHKVIMPSINELRYAGRRLVEIFLKIEAKAPAEEVRALYNDVQFNCLRARHDAIDSAVSKIAVTADIAAKKLGYDAILKAYPEFPQLIVSLDQIKSSIAKSRKDRENREAIYATVSESNLPNLVKQYAEFQSCEPIMKELAAKDRRNRLISYSIGVLGLVVGIVSILT